MTRLRWLRRYALRRMFVHFIFVFYLNLKRNTLKAVIYNDDVKDALSMVIKGHTTVNVTPVIQY